MYTPALKLVLPNYLGMLLTFHIAAKPLLTKPLFPSPVCLFLFPSMVQTNLLSVSVFHLHFPQESVCFCVAECKPWYWPWSLLQHFFHDAFTRIVTNTSFIFYHTSYVVERHSILSPFLFMYKLCHQCFVEHQTSKRYTVVASTRVPPPQPLPI